MRSYGDDPPCPTGAQGLAHARLAIASREPDLDDSVPAMADGCSPTAAPPSHGTDGLLLFPVNHKAAHVESLSRSSLPFVIRPCWTEQFDAMLPLARHQQFCIQIACINHLEA
jgi:hypothetical protein